MTKLIVSPNLAELPEASRDVVPVWLYGGMPWQEGSASIGATVLEEVSRIRAPISDVSLDLVSLSMAVTAADTFSPRDAAPDGWARTIDLTVALSDPDRWQPTTALLERTLRFLSGDNWTIRIIGGGKRPPTQRPRIRRKVVLEGCDSACLYSGGLDSAIGVLNLRAQGRTPVLVSHAYSGDASRQLELLHRLGIAPPRFGAIANPLRWSLAVNDVQMRTRSFNFLAMGALVATAVKARTGMDGSISLFVPENGLIAINPPLTNRRIGALSTRTTHPHYLALIQELFDAVEVPVSLDNPFAHMTKGEMVKACVDQTGLDQIAWRTVSCGHWKRQGVQCGRCVPCLIRRASFHAAGFEDKTPYLEFGRNLTEVFLKGGVKSDDLMAMMRAADKLDMTNVAAWIAKTGPLPTEAADRSALTEVVTRGIGEVRTYLIAQGLIA
jgi:hypothetical protein